MMLAGGLSRRHYHLLLELTEVRIGWARDFELPASNLGHHYLAIHNDQIIHGDAMPPGMNIPEGFHDPGIHVQPEPIIAAIRAFQKAKVARTAPQFPPHQTRFKPGQTTWS